MVYVYYNLHKNCLSVKKDGIVVDYRKTIHLKNVKFVVSKTGRRRVLKTKTKKVHAFVVGEITNIKNFKPSKQITYNPYKFESFVDKRTGKSVYSADICIINGKNIYI